MRMKLWFSSVSACVLAILALGAGNAVAQHGGHGGGGGGGGGGHSFGGGGGGGFRGGSFSAAPHASSYSPSHAQNGVVHNNVYGNNYAGRGYGYGRNGYGYGYNGWNRGWGGWGGWGWGWPWYTAAWAWGYPYYGGYYPGYYAAYTYPDYGLYSTDVDVPVTQGTVDNSPPDSFASNSTAATESAETDPQWLGEAQEAFRQGDYRNAARLAAHAAIDSPQDPKAHEIASLALFAAGQFRGAAMEAHAALAMAPASDWPTLYSYYGDLPTYQRQLRALETFIGKNPNSPDGHFLLGYHDLMMGHRDAARDQFGAGQQRSAPGQDRPADAQRVART